MKKLVLILVASALVAPAFAATGNGAQSGAHLHPEPSRQGQLSGWRYDRQ